MRKIIFFLFRISIISVIIAVLTIRSVLFILDILTSSPESLTDDMVSNIIGGVECFGTGILINIFFFFWGKKTELQEDDVSLVLCDVAEAKAIPYFVCEAVRKSDKISFNSYPQDSSVLSPNKAYLQLVLKENDYDNLEAYLILKIQLKLVPQNYIYTYKTASLIPQGRDDILSLGVSRFYKPNKKDDAAYIEAFLYLFHKISIDQGESLDTSAE